MNMKHTLLAAAFFASVGTQAQPAVGSSTAETAPAWTRVKVRVGKSVARKTAAAKPQAERIRTYCCGNCGTCGVRG